MIDTWGFVSLPFNGIYPLNSNFALKDTQLIYGLRPVMEAIKAGRDFERLYIQKNIEGEGIRQLRQLLANYHIHYQFVPVEKLNRLTQGNHQGVVGILSYIAYSDIEQLLPGIFEKGEIPFLVIADRITDVRNFGAIARTAECAGVHAIVVPDQESAMINADALKTSAGALARIPVCRSSNLRVTALFLRESGVKIIAVSEKGNENYTQTDLTGPVALILGSEENGISPQLLKMADHICKIPLLGEIASLNVSVASGIVMYEVVRQRNNF
ncbi:MAG: rRNA (guanosine2251-2-O)-methyltransferase [Bacteroidales bacterium]|nr:rRNA (guanosine2251-2-O)-methyltransferase [Bacteroidales bacterium]MDN5328932.1 rRNA (guanosine2251-2-O)-methyltransferase [Bacteroidales bacterium]